jgi:hypothetical protein
MCHVFAICEIRSQSTRFVRQERDEKRKLFYPNKQRCERIVNNGGGARGLLSGKKGRIMDTNNYGPQRTTQQSGASVVPVQNN